MKTLLEVHEDVPANHYDVGIARNPFQRYWHKSRMSKLKEFLFRTNGRILDIGCHSGLLTAEISKLNPDAEIYGIDVSASAIKLAKKRIEKGNFRVANAHKLPFRENFFDGVVCLEVLEHVEDPQKVLGEIHRTVKKKASVFLLIPTDNLLFKLVWKIWNLRYRHWKHAHVQSFKKKSLETLAKNKGFEIKNVHTFNLGMLKIIELVKN